MTTNKKVTIEQGNGEVDIDITKTGIHVTLTNTPKWTYILIGIGLMFLFIFVGHAVFSYFKNKDINAIAEKLVRDEPLTDKDAKLMESLSEPEMKQLKKDVRNKMSIETDGMKVEQTTAPGMKVKIEKDGDKTTITKGGK